MKRGGRLRVLSAIAAAGVAIGSVLTPTAASAAVVTSISFVTTGPVEVTFGEDWLLVLTVDSSYEDGPTLKLTPTDGTVDVFFSGIGGAFASGLAIQPDGKVYVSQPADKPLLPAGSYEVSAVFNPDSGGYYASSQTATPLTMTVAGLTATPTVEVTNDPSVSERPVITARLGGSYVEATGGAPAGTWHFTVTSADGVAVFETDVAQAQGAVDPVRVEIDSQLQDGGQYAVKSTFSVVDELAGGVTTESVSDSVFQTPSGSFAEAISAPVAIPVWAAALLLLVLLGLAAAAIVVGVKLAGRKAVPAADGGPLALQRMPGDPVNVEVVSLEDMGLPDPTTIPELLPDVAATQKLPTSTTWLLSDVEPATTIPDQAEAPTERIDTVSARGLDLPVSELPDTGATDASTDAESTTDGEEPSK